MKRQKPYENMSREELKASSRELLNPKEFIESIFDRANSLFSYIDIRKNTELLVYSYQQTRTICYCTKGHIIGVLEMNERGIDGIAVKKEYRRSGIARKLITEALKQGATQFYGNFSSTMTTSVWQFYHEKWRFENYEF